MRIRVIDKYYKLKFKHCRPTKECKNPVGYCDAPWKKNKRIVLHNKIDTTELLADALIHEMLHAADWYKDEDWVELVARDIAHAITKLFHLVPKQFVRDHMKQLAYQELAREGEKLDTL